MFVQDLHNHDEELKLRASARLLEFVILRGESGEKWYCMKTETMNCDKYMCSTK